MGIGDWGLGIGDWGFGDNAQDERKVETKDENV